MSGAPLAFALWSALGVLSVCLSDSTAMDHFGRQLRPNMYLLLVGASGSRKTHAIDLAGDILTVAAPEMLGNRQKSPESLEKSLARRGQQLLVYGEWGDFLAHTERSYAEPLRTLLTDLYDCRAYVSETKKGGELTIQAPRVSILGACAPSLLEEHTQRQDWEGGFLGRFGLVHAEPERDVAKPVGYDLRAPLAELLSRRVAPKIPPCLGFSYESEEIWEAWKAQKTEQIAGMGQLARVLGARWQMVARKIAMLLEVDAGPVLDTPQPWSIQPQRLIAALRMTEIHLDSLVSITQDLQGTPFARMCVAIRREIEERGPITAQQVARCVDPIPRPRDLESAIAALIGRGDIQDYEVSGGVTWYSIKKPGTVAPLI